MNCSISWASHEDIKKGYFFAQGRMDFITAFTKFLKLFRQGTWKKISFTIIR